MSEEATLDDYTDESEISDDATDQPKRELIQGVAWSTLDYVPDDWVVNNIGSDVKLLAGNNFSSDGFVDEGGIPLIRIRDLATDETTVNFAGEYDSRYLIEEGDLLVGMDGEFEPHLWSGPQSLLNQRVCKIKSKDQYNKVFLRYGIEKPLYYIQKSIAGTTVKHLSQSDVRDINLPTPPLEEQRKIATVLYTVDQAILKAEKIIKEANTVKRGLIQDVMKGSGSNSSTEEKRVGPRTVTLPRDWDVVKIGEAIERNIIRKQQDGNHGSDYPRKDEFVNEGVPYLSAKMLSNGRVDFSQANYLTEERANQLRIGFAQDGDVLLAHNATVGPTGVVSTEREFVIIGTSLTYYRCNQDELENKYLSYFFQSDIFQKQLQDLMRQSTRNQVPITRQRNLNLILPPVDEQRRISEKIDAVVDEVEKEIDYRNRLKRLKQGLMQNLLSGAVRTHDADIDIHEAVLAHD